MPQSSSFDERAAPGKRDIARAFGGATLYDDHAIVQRQVAARLAAKVGGLPLVPQPKILEIGCGTGFLSRALRQKIDGAEWTLTDLSPEMVERCRSALGDPGDSRFLVMDGEHPGFSPPRRFDLICSSLAAQWFEDLPAGLRRLSDLLAPGGAMVIATLGERTFAEWRRAQEIAGHQPGPPRYPSLPAFQALDFPGCEIEAEQFEIAEHHAGALDFLRSLKAIGAHTPGPGQGVMPAGALRRVCRAFETLGSVASYHVVMLTVRNPAGSVQRED